MLGRLSLCLCVLQTSMFQGQAGQWSCIMTMSVTCQRLLILHEVGAKCYLCIQNAARQQAHSSPYVPTALRLF